MEFAFITMEFALKTMEFALITMEFVLKPTSFFVLLQASAETLRDVSRELSKLSAVVKRQHDMLEEQKALIDRMIAHQGGAGGGAPAAAAGGGVAIQTLIFD